MTSFYMTVMRFIDAFIRSLKDPEFRAMLLVVFGLLVSGTLFYSGVEGWPVVDALYFSVMTLATVGCGDLSPSTELSKIFTILYVVVGVGVFLSFIAKLQAHRRSKADAGESE